MTKLKSFSYSRLSTFIQCPMRYKLKYVDGNYDSTDAIHLDLGNILHKVLELKYRNIIDNVENDYDYLRAVLSEGIAEDTEKDKGNFLMGVNGIKDKFGEQSFFEINAKSGLSYIDKLNTFYTYLETDQLDDDWQPLAVELDFNIPFEDRITLNGFIDRIDINKRGELRVVDYKSSNKVFDDKDLKTPLQMVVYALACQEIYGKIPVEYQYDMVLLGEKQLACSKGYLNRGIKKLHKVIDEIEECERTGVWKPKATPLCHWCDFSVTNPNGMFHQQELCNYYCLWTPTNRTFEKNKEFVESAFEEFEF